MTKHDYDLIVLGSGPAGHHAALEAAKLGKRTLVIDRHFELGGACLHTGTIPSKTLREAALYLSGFRQRSFYGRGYRVKAKIQVEDLMFRVSEVIKRQFGVLEDQLQRAGVEVLSGHGRFHPEPHTIEAELVDGRRKLLTADFILIACGTRPARRDDIPFEAPQVYDSDELIQVTEGELPRSMIVVGGGVIGLEYTSMMAALGVEVTVLEARGTLLNYVDEEITQTLMYHLRRFGVTFRLNEKVVSVAAPESGGVIATLESGKTLSAETLLYAVGRQPNADRINIEAVGLTLEDRGRLATDADFRTAVPYIFAAGDVVGFPSLASTSMEQGRHAACCMFGVCRPERQDLWPYGIYTIPEISMVGKTEQQLTAARIPYETGIAPFEEVAKAQIVGDQTGLLKIIFHAETRVLLGVHIIGEGAVELVHIGQTLMMTGGTVDVLRDTVFNYPSLAEAYRVAAANGLDRLRRRELGIAAVAD